MTEHYGGRQSELAPLSKLSDYEVASDSIDVRGWKVSGSTGSDVGRIDDLIVDSGSMQARYLVVTLAGDPQPEPVLVPVARARIDDKDRRVMLDSSGARLAELPRYRGADVDRDYNETFGRHEQAGTYDEDTHRLTRSAEELRIGKRDVKAGEVKVRKHVETERVKEPVSRTREEVKVERRPVAGRESARADIREDEVRIPIIEEEVVAEKRPVVKEELVVGKEKVHERENVEADLKKERVDVDRSATPDDYGRKTKARGEV